MAPTSFSPLGPAGPTGPSRTGPTGPVSLVPGPTGPSGGPLIPGGATGQVPVKDSDADFDASWHDSALLAQNGQSPSQSPPPVGYQSAVGSMDRGMRADGVVPSGGPLSAMWGSSYNSGGSVLLNGQGVSGFTLTGNVYTITSLSVWQVFDNVTVAAGYVFRPILSVVNPFFWVRDVLQVDGELTATGAGGGGGAGGTAVGSAGGVANSGTGCGNSRSGGAGGTGASGSGGAGGANTSNQTWFPYVPFTAFSALMVRPDGTLHFMQGGPGGGGGGGDGTNAGGHGGAGGGLFIVSARQLLGSGTISADGTAGATPTVGNCGGGGGGGNGLLFVNTNDDSNWSGTLTAASGAGGAGVGTGTAGASPATGYNSTTTTFLQVWT